MSPSILIVGATGNTGGGVLHHLSSVLPSSKLFSNHLLIGLTRDKTGKTATELGKLPHVEIVESDWVMIDAEWLRSHEVERIFIAPHNGASHFTDETLFLNAALEAGVKYLVRISTIRNNMGPTTPVFYGRNHWAVETMLEQPEFEGLAWTSLQPNAFSTMFFPHLQGWLKEYRETGKKGPVYIFIDGDVGIAAIDPFEIGLIAGHLLALDDPSPHASKKYVLSGPADVNGKDLIHVLEKHAGTVVDDVTFRDPDWIKHLGVSGFAPNVGKSLSFSHASSATGSASFKAMPTSPEVAELYAPRNAGLDMLDEALSKL